MRGCPPRRQSGRGQLQQTGRAAPGAGHSQRSAGACKSSTPVVPVQRTESWGCSVQGAASPEGAGGPARGLRGATAECPPRATGPHGARGGSPRPCLPGLGTCRPGPPQARRLVTSSAPPRPLWGTHLPNSTASGTWGERLHTVTALWATPRLVPCCPHIPGVMWPIGCCDSPFVTHDGRPAGRDALEPTALGCAGRPAGPTFPLWPDTHVRPHRGPGPPGSHTVTLVSTGTRRPIHSINVYFKLGEIHIT